MQPGFLTPGTLFHRVFHDSPIGMVITTIAESRYADVNQAYCDLLGYSREELIGQRSPIAMPTNEDERQLILDVLQRAYKLGDIPLLLQTRHGEPRHCVSSLQLEHINGIPCFISIIQDITPQEQAREALRFANNRFRHLFQAIPLPLIVYDQESLKIIDFNDAAIRLFGYSREELDGSNFINLLPPEERAGFAKEGLSSNGKVRKNQICRQQLKDGSIVDVDVDGYSFYLEDRQVTLLIIRNVTEERAHQTSLQISEERLRIIAELASDALWEHDLITGEIEWSSGLSSLFGYTDDERRPETWWIDHIHPEDRPRIQQFIEAIQTTAGSNWVDEYRFLHADGYYVNVLDRGYLLRDESGRAVRFIGAMVDISKPLQVAEVAANATMEERQRLARDLQDSVTQSLYSVSLMAEAARRYKSGEDRQLKTEIIGRIGEISQNTLRQLRLLLYDLRPSVLEQEGLTGALRHRLEAVERRAGVQGRLIDELEMPIPKALQIEIFLIAQVVLNNFLKYSSVSSITIVLKTAGDKLIIEINHDGNSIGKMLLKDEEKLIAMNERITALGGEYDVVALLDGGEQWQYCFPQVPATH